ncbi:DedA family protein [Brachybacterium paraconglomeratum]|uniref:DedA family protein n=1 Tax=Brachybacterium paraconglomeratum TaxID=173362 RepID=UPI0021A27A47|nr:VTT domain-containing protein [Brachybacterium paraconglomeratum]MCT1909320.1 VTT domain-containing protein [Brachybacterium paraconglomeratum]
MDSVLHLVEAVMASPWLYVLLFAVVAADSVLPVFPGETVLITAGAYAVAQESPHALVLIPMSIAAALSGDLIAHHVGRGAGPLTGRIRSRRTGDKLLTWAENSLSTRGGSIIVTARFIPGGRTATSIASGMIRYPRPAFAGFALLAATAWALYNVGIGMAGGLLFRERPLLGVVLGIALALVLSWLIERIRSGRETRSRVLQSTTS